MTAARRAPIPFPSPVADDEPLLTIDDVAARLQVSPRQVGRFLARRYHRLPAVRLGRKVVRIRASSLAAWIAEEEQG